MSKYYLQPLLEEKEKERDKIRIEHREQIKVLQEIEKDLCKVEREIEALKFYLEGKEFQSEQLNNNHSKLVNILDIIKSRPEGITSRELTELTGKTYNSIQGTLDYHTKKKRLIREGPFVGKVKYRYKYNEIADK